MVDQFFPNLPGLKMNLQQVILLTASSVKGIHWTFKIIAVTWTLWEPHDAFVSVSALLPLLPVCDSSIQWVHVCLLIFGCPLRWDFPCSPSCACLTTEAPWFCVCSVSLNSLWGLLFFCPVLLFGVSCLGLFPRVFLCSCFAMRCSHSALLFPLFRA